MSKALELADACDKQALAWRESSEPYKERKETAAELRRLAALEQAFEDARTEAVALRATEQNLTEQLAAWKAALTPLMPGDFKDWHDNHDSELPQVAAFVVENLRARIAELEAAQPMQWQPIETAPFGEYVILSSPTSGTTFDDFGHYAKYNQPAFTHWLPLPPPRTGAKVKQ